MLHGQRWVSKVQGDGNCLLKICAYFNGSELHEAKRSVITLRCGEEGYRRFVRKSSFRSIGITDTVSNLFENPQYTPAGVCASSSGRSQLSAAVHVMWVVASVDDTLVIVTPFVAKFDTHIYYSVPLSHTCPRSVLTATSRSASQEIPSPILMQPEDSLPCSEESAAGPYPEPDESSPYLPALFP